MGYCHTPLFEVGTIKSPSVFANEKLYQIYLPYFYKKSVGEVEFTKTTSYNKHYFVKKGDQFIFVLQEKSFDEKMFDSINHTYSKEIHYTTLPLRGNNISFTRFDFKKEIDEYPKTLVLTSPNYTLKLSGFAEEYVDRDGYYYQIKNITSNDIYNTGNIYPTDYAPCFPTVNKCKNVKSKTSFLTNEKEYYNHVVGKIYNIDGLFYLLKDNGNIFIYEKYPSFLLQKEYSSFTLGGDIVLQEDDCYNFKIGANVATNTKWFNENELIKYKTVTTTTSTIKFDLYTFKYPEKNEYVKTLYNIYTKGICKNKTVNTNTFTTVSTTFNDFLYCPMSIGMGNETMNTCTIGDKVLFWKDDQRDWRVYINRQSLGLRY